MREERHTMDLTLDADDGFSGIVEYEEEIIGRPRQEPKPAADREPGALGNEPVAPVVRTR
jgi:hypothetical protein